MDLKTIFIVLAAIAFGCGALSVSVPRVNWTNAGLCLLTIGLLIV